MHRAHSTTQRRRRPSPTRAVAAGLHDTRNIARIPYDAMREKIGAKHRSVVKHHIRLLTLLPPDPAAQMPHLKIVVAAAW